MKYKAARSCVSAMQPRPARASTMMGASNMEEPVNQDIINLYDRFTHGGMSRRTFLDRLAELAGSTAAAAALLPLLQTTTREPRSCPLTMAGSPQNGSRMIPPRARSMVTSCVARRRAARRHRHP
jgi:hypothetical protein